MRGARAGARIPWCRRTGAAVGSPRLPQGRRPAPGRLRRRRSPRADRRARGSNTTSRPGASAANTASRRGTSAAASTSLTNRRHGPVAVAGSKVTGATIARTAASASRRRGCSAAARGVGTRPAPPRTNSGSRSARRSRPSARLAAGCDRSTRSPARVMLRVSNSASSNASPFKSICRRSATSSSFCMVTMLTMHWRHGNDCLSFGCRVHPPGTSKTRRSNMYAVAGVTGQTGAAVAEALLAAGQHVRVIVRRAEAGAGWRRSAGAEVAVADLADPVALAAALARHAGRLSAQPAALRPRRSVRGRRAVGAASRMRSTRAASRVPSCCRRWGRTSRRAPASSGPRGGSSRRCSRCRRRSRCCAPTTSSRTGATCSPPCSATACCRRSWRRSTGPCRWWRSRTSRRRSCAC